MLKFFSFKGKLYVFSLVFFVNLWKENKEKYFLILKNIFKWSAGADTPLLPRKFCIKQKVSLKISYRVFLGVVWRSEANEMEA